MMPFGFGKLADRCTKASASRKLRNRNVRSMRRASSRSAQSGTWLWKRRASSRASGGTPPRQGVQVFSARVSVMWLSPNRTNKCNGGRSAIDLPEHDVERAEDRRNIGQHMPAAQEIHRLQMGERRRPDLAPVGPVGAVRHQVDAELALGRLDRGVDLAGGHVMALAVELEMVDGRLHRALHLGAQRRHDLVVLDGNRSPTFWQPRSEEHTSELQSLAYLVCRLLLEKKKKTK